MIPALIIASFTAIVGLIIYIFELRYRRKHPLEESGTTENDATSVAQTVSGDAAAVDNTSADTADSNQEAGQQECCGLHLVCEKDSLSPVTDTIDYYDDEELDRFRGRTADSYSAEEVEEFRDVMMTLLPQDISGWARSITMRNLELPTEVRDELLLLVNEQRSRVTQPSVKR